MKLFDVTRTIYDGMPVYEGDPRVVVRRVASVATGACANVSEIRFGSHTGTHVDPPLHFLDDADGVDALPLDVLIGPAHLYELAVRGCIDLVALRGVDLASSPRLLFKTCLADAGDAHGSLPEVGGLTAEAARALVTAGVRLVGLDSASADPPGSLDFSAHRTLLEAGIVILEGMDLSAVPPGPYELLCLPLKLRNGDGAPARVVLRAPD